MKISACRAIRHFRDFSSQLQQLEPREAPAGLVTAVQASGLLTITGLDDLSPAGVTGGLNDQEVHITGTGAGSFDVSVANGTQFKGTASTTLSFSGVTAVKFDMRLGSDIVIVNNASLSGDLSFLGGGGNDSLIIGGAPGNQSFGSVTVKNGDGDDSFSIGNGNNTIAVKLSIDNGIGNSLVTLNMQAADQLSVGDVIVKNTDGLDTLMAGGASVTAKSMSISNGNGGSITKLASTSFSVSGGFTLTNAIGFDQTTLGATGGTFNVGKGVTIASGAGDSIVDFAATTTIASAASANLAITNLNGHDTTMFAAVSVGNLLAKFTGSVVIDNGAGGGSVLFNGKTVLNGGLTVRNSTGIDDFSITGSAFTATGPIAITNASGGSTINLTPSGSLSLSKPLIVTNAAGFDTVNLGAATATVSVNTVTIADGVGGSLTQLAGTSLTSAAVSISAADGDDSVSLLADDFEMGLAGLSIKTGNGASNVNIQAAVQLNAGVVAIENAAGDAAYTIGDAASTIVLKSLSLKNGNGTSSTILDGLIGIGSLAAPGALAITNLEGANALDVLADLTVAGTVTISNGGGGSVATFEGPNTLITGNLTVTNLDGDDAFATAGGAFEVDGLVTINNGVGEGGSGSEVQFGAASNILGKPLTIKAAGGDDAVKFTGGTTAKAITIDLGNDLSEIDFSGPTDMTGALLITTGDGDDIVNVSDSLNVAGAVTIKTNAGNDSISWNAAPSDISGAIAIVTGDGTDTLLAANLISTGATVSIDMGSLNDLVQIDDSSFNGAVTINMSTGNDSLLIETQDTAAKSRFAGALTIKLDSGNDLMDVGINGDTDDFGQFLGAVKVDGGLGIDIVHALPSGVGGNRANTFAFPLATPGVELLD